MQSVLFLLLVSNSVSVGRTRAALSPNELDRELDTANTTADGLWGSSSSTISYGNGPCIQDDGTIWFPSGYDRTKTVAPESTEDEDEDETGEDETDDDIYRPWEDYPDCVQIVASVNTSHSRSPAYPPGSPSSASRPTYSRSPAYPPGSPSSASRPTYSRSPAYPPGSPSNASRPTHSSSPTHAPASIGGYPHSSPINVNASRAPSLSPSSVPVVQFPHGTTASVAPTSSQPYTRKPASSTPVAFATFAPSKGLQLTQIPTSPPSVVFTRFPNPYPSRRPGSLPALPGEFYDANVSHLISCSISCAFPPLSRRYLKEQRHNFIYEEGEGDNEGDPMYGAASRFARNVRDILKELIEDNTNYTVLCFDDLRRSLRHDDAVFSNYSDEDIILAHSKLNSNVTERETLEGSHRGVVWWEYTNSFFTVENNYTQVEDTIRKLVSESIATGHYLARLQEKFSRLVAVSIPGNEALAIGDSDSSDSADDAEDFIDVDDWSPSRWAGLGLFVCTLSLMTLLMRTATQRRKRIEEQENWGVGLASEADINQLLAYGWDYDGEQLYAFDKTKAIYHHDDPALIGGSSPPDNELGAITERLSLSESPTNSPTDGSPSSGIGTTLSENHIESASHELPGDGSPIVDSSSSGVSA